VNIKLCVTAAPSPFIDDHVICSKEITMSSIIEELRTNKRQLSEFSRRRRSNTSTVSAADDINNNDNNDKQLMTSQSSQVGRVWNDCSSTLTPTSSAASHGQSRSRRRRRPGELCFDEFGALDLTASKKPARTPNASPRPTSAVPINLVADDSVPLDLSVHSRPPCVVNLI